MQRELGTGAQVRSNLQRAGRFGHVIVPRVHAELCTRKLLVMEEVSGPMSPHQITSFHNDAWPLLAFFPPPFIPFSSHSHRCTCAQVHPSTPLHVALDRQASSQWDTAPATNL